LGDVADEDPMKSGGGGEAGSACFTRDAAAMITWADEAMLEVLGWRADQLVGPASTDFIHSEDQPSAIGAWFSMLGDLVGSDGRAEEVALAGVTCGLA
jgi:hypothetical protein